MSLLKLHKMPSPIAIAENTYKFEEKDCEAVVLYRLKEPGGRKPSLYIVASRLIVSLRDIDRISFLSVFADLNQYYEKNKILMHYAPRHCPISMLGKNPRSI